MKTEYMRCEQCWKQIVRKNAKQKYCTRCSNKMNREMTNRRRNAQ